jgi:formylglycine-generating enzyme required for sulfatase activity
MYDFEKPVHSVTVRSFYLGKYEVTQKEWTEVMGTTVQQQWTAASSVWRVESEVRRSF